MLLWQAVSTSMAAGQRSMTEKKKKVVLQAKKPISKKKNKKAAAAAASHSEQAEEGEADRPPIQEDPLRGKIRESIPFDNLTRANLW